MSADLTLQQEARDINNSDGQLKNLRQTSTAHTNDIKMKNTKISGTVKAERNKRKKENLKKAKAAVRQKAEEEKRLLDKMCALTIKEREEETQPGGKLWIEPASHDGSTTSCSKGLPFIPPGLLFTFELSTEKGGIGSFALEDITQGTEILVEQAIIQGTNEYLCKEALFDVLSKEKKDRIKALYSRCNCRKSPCTESTLMKAWEVNAYGSPTGPALYELAARFNHDCLPNIARGFSEEGFIVFRAARDIKQGEELTVNYSMIPGPAKIRQDYLLDKFKFLCKCHGCKKKLVYTLSDSQKGKLPQDVQPTSPVIGEHSIKEVAIQAEVETWFKQAKEDMASVELGLFKHLSRKALAGDPSVADFKSRALLADRTLRFMAGVLKQNNKFGLDDAIFESFRTRNIQRMIRTTEQNFSSIAGQLVQFPKDELTSN